MKQIQAMNLETKEHKQRLIDIFVNDVYLYDDKLVIAFNYKEATKTVSLKEVNGSIIECSGAPKKTTFVLVGKGCFFKLNPPCRVGEIIFDDEIPFGDEIRLDGGWVDLISSVKQISLKS